MKYRWIIIDEDTTPRGTNDETCAMAYAKNPCATVVIDTELNIVYFEGSEHKMEVQSFNPDDWK